MSRPETKGIDFRKPRVRNGIGDWNRGGGRKMRNGGLRGDFWRNSIAGLGLTSRLFHRVPWLTTKIKRLYMNREHVTINFLSIEKQSTLASTKAIYEQKKEGRKTQWKSDAWWLDWGANKMEFRGIYRRGNRRLSCRWQNRGRTRNWTKMSKFCPWK